MSSVPDEEKSASILEASGNTHAFILIKQEEGYSLFYLRQEEAAIKRLQIPLSEVEMSKLHKVIYPNGKNYLFRLILPNSVIFAVVMEVNPWKKTISSFLSHNV